MLTTYQLNKMRRIHEQVAMPDTATIYRRSVTADDSGGESSDWSEKVGEVACRLAFEGGNRPVMPDGVSGGAIEAKERYILTVPVSTDIEITDRVEISDHTYQVISANNTRSFETAKRLLVQAV